MKIFIYALFAVLVMAGCSSDEPSPDDSGNGEVKDMPFPKITLSTDEKAIANAQNEFGMKFFSQIAQERGKFFPNDNFAVSPLSATLALSMMANTASGETEQAIIKLLGMSDINALNAYNSRIQKELQFENKFAVLTLVNNFWCSNQYTFSDGFKSLMQSVFGATPQYVDFSDPKTVDIINQWSSDNTNGKIPVIVEDLKPTTTSVLANAMYYKSAWNNEFDPSNTQYETFHGIKGDITVSMMHNVVYERFAELADGTKITSLTFKEANAMMFFILPPENVNVFDYASKMDYSYYTGEFANVYKNGYEVSISIPRFKTDMNFVMDSFLASNGVKLSYDMSKIGINAIKESSVTQFSSVEVNEKGAEVAAVTVDIGYTANTAPHAEFKADRPFIYLIKEENTEAILIAGVYASPEESGL